MNMATVEWADTMAEAVAGCILADHDPTEPDDIKSLRLIIEDLEHGWTVYDRTCDRMGWDPLAERDRELRAYAWRRHDPAP